VTRATEVWVGATDDAAIPKRVRIRVFESTGGRCALSGRLIRPGDAWQVDHKLALVNGGQHIETNMQPVLSEPHKAKTAADVKTKAKTARMKAAHLGLKPKGRGFGNMNRKFNGTVGLSKRAQRERDRS
jgi:5-methylcytosine-specific restriction enzyme A